MSNDQLLVLLGGIAGVVGLCIHVGYVVGVQDGRRREREDQASRVAKSAVAKAMRKGVTP